MRPPRRLAVHPLTTIERGPPLSFRFDGRRIEAYAGETVAAALYAAHRTTLSRSMRYHRARGLFCGSGGCTHCFLRIDGVPNRRACLAPCEATTWAEGQNAFPTVEHDLLAASDVAFPRYLDAHSSFARPGWIRRAYLPFVRALSGFGRVPREPVAQRFDEEQIETELLVVGAGPAGLAAARTAGEAGADVLLVEAEPKTGGRLRHLPTPFHAVRLEHAPKEEGKAYADAQAAALRHAGTALRLDTRVFATYDGTWIAAGRARLLRIRPKRVVLAAGATDAYEPFPGSDRAGTLLPTAAARLLNMHGIAPADPVVIYGATRAGLLLARDLVACGVHVRGVFDPASSIREGPLAEDARRLGVPVAAGHRIAFVAGRRRPRAVVFDAPGGRVRVPCATLVSATGRVTLGALFHQAGAQIQLDPARGGAVPVLGSRLETTVRGLYAAGSAAGLDDEWSSVLQGRIAGAAAALSLSPTDPRRERILAQALDGYVPPRPAGPMEEVAA